MRAIVASADDARAALGRVRRLADRVAAPRAGARTHADRALARRAGRARRRPRARSTTRSAACCAAGAHCRRAASSSCSPTSSATSAPARGWGSRRLASDVVPVVIQDPTWERSFPDVSGVLLPVVDVETGAPRPVRLTRRETRARRAAARGALRRADAAVPQGGHGPGHARRRRARARPPGVPRMGRAAGPSAAERAMSMRAAALAALAAAALAVAGAPRRPTSRCRPRSPRARRASATSCTRR